MFSNKLSKYLECFPGKKPDYISYCSTLMTNENAQIEQITLNDFCKQHGFEYSSSLNVQANEMKRFYKNWDTIEKKYDCKTPIFDCMVATSQSKSFIVCKISPEIGHGLFLSPDVPAVSRGAIVMTYAGILKTPDKDKRMNTDYAMNFDILSKFDIKSILKTESKYCYVDAKKIGNLSRFIQHAPTEDELGQMGDTHAITSKIVTANLISRLVWHLGFPVHCLQATRDIYPGEQLCLSYGTEYFDCLSKDKKSFALFSTAGDIIANTRNHYLIFIEPVDNLNIESLADAPRANILLHEFQKNFAVTAQPNNMQDLQKYLFDVYRLCFKNYIYCIPEKTENYYEIISYLNNCIDALSSDDDNVLFAIKRDLCSFSNEQDILKPLDSQLLKLPLKYDVLMEMENKRSMHY